MKLDAAIDSVLCDQEDCVYCSLYETDKCKLKKEVQKQKISKPKVLCLYVSLPEEITKETLKSIKTQSFPVSNLILVTERSSKPSLDERISEVINNALSKVDLAKYDYILSVDSNNILPPNFLEANLAVEPDIMRFGSTQIIKVKPFLEIMGGRFNHLQEAIKIRHKFATYGLRASVPVVTPDWKLKTGSTSKSVDCTQQLELPNRLGNWVPIVKKPPFADHIRKKTAGLRRRVALEFMRCLVPKLAVEVTEILEYIDRKPRPFTKFLKKQFDNKPLVGVEIGFGYNAENLLKELNIKQLYCVDPCFVKPYVTYGGTVNSNYADIEKTKYFDLKENPRVSFVQLPSDEAFKVLPSDLNFVYVDGVHGYGQVLRDLRNAYTHVKHGGFVGGHDFVKGCEVVPAVFDFTIEIGKVPTIEMPDFWFKLGP
jgi:hypothetical protein